MLFKDFIKEIHLVVTINEMSFIAVSQINRGIHQAKNQPG